MQRGDDGTLILSPTDLVGHLACRHLTHLSARVAAGELGRPEHDDPELEVRRRRGDEHERNELVRFRQQGRSIAEITPPGADATTWAAAEAATVAAMRRGVDVVYQAAFSAGRWRGRADFLLRVESPTALGPWGYEVADTKLARRAKPDAVVQLCAYSEHVTRIQGVAPHDVVVITGDGAHHRFRLHDAAAYHRAAKRRLEAAVDHPGPAPYPEKVPHCARCPWAPRCDARRRADGHLSLVAGVRPDMVPKLAAAGITTVAGLARSPVGEPVPSMGQHTANRLRHQARLQLAQQVDGRVRYELVPPEEGVEAPGGVEAGGEASPAAPRGLAALPAPSAGDLFFDIEGDPWVGDHGIQYLFGFVEHGPGGPAYRSFWAHTPAAEKRALEAVVDFLVERLDADPAMHVYHYAPYEVTVLRTLAGRYVTRQAEVDQLLRAEVFVDLYRVAVQGVRVSQDGYGLKKLEPLFLAPREGAVTDGASSIVVYEEWLTTGEQHLLDDIGDYNEVDCRSTLALRDWLEGRRSELEGRLDRPLPRPAAPDRGSSMRPSMAEAETAVLLAGLRAGVPDDPTARRPDDAGRALLAGLVDYHRQEAKPAWWSYFERLRRTDAELVDDREAIGGLTHEGEVGGDEASVVHRYRYDPGQDHRIPVGSRPRDPRTGAPAGEVAAAEPETGTIDLVRRRSHAAGHPMSLVPAPPADDAVLRRAVARVGAFVVDHGLDADLSRHRAVRDLLLRRPPATAAAAPAGNGRPLARPGESAIDAARRLVPRLEGAVLAIQGPPGSGKTHTGAVLVVDALARGERVGITANTHRAITNLVDAVCSRAEAEGVAARVVQKARPGEGSGASLVELVADNISVLAALDEGAPLVAGTAWLFARPELEDRLDLLVIDEAGQVPLANLVAVAACATDVVLLGDPQQLPQVSQGIHPRGVAVSALEHVLGGAETIEPWRGLFLDTSWRMHPELGSFVSELAYEGRLRSHPDCARQAVGDGPLVAGSGIRLLPVSHEGNRTRSVEEAAAVADVVGALVGREWTAADGVARRLTLDDVLVIAPFNDHVACLAEVLPAAARVGTVDRFQGQEAPVVIYSTAASSATDARRGIEFLFSVQRLNVAVSRARALAVVVSSPSLQEARVHTVEQLRLVNALCRLAEVARPLEGTGALARAAPA